MAIFSMIYFVLSYVQMFPQIIKLIKTKSSTDYSLSHVILQFIAIASWAVYVYTSEQSIVVYIGTVFDLLLLFICDFFIIKYYKFDKDKKNVKDN